MCHHIFFLNDTATPEIYPLSLHDALPIWIARPPSARASTRSMRMRKLAPARVSSASLSSECTLKGERSRSRSEEHTSELQSRLHLVCRLLLEKQNLAYSLRSYRVSHMHHY